jgi:hypothetical protein
MEDVADRVDLRGRGSRGEGKDGGGDGERSVHAGFLRPGLDLLRRIDEKSLAAVSRWGSMAH